MRTIVIDVRTEKEFREGSYPGALNISSLNATEHQFTPFKDYHIALVCNSGIRAQKVQFMLIENGYQNVTLLNYQMNQLNEGLKKSSSIWSIDRQFRLVLGLFIGLFMVGYFLFNSPLAIGILFIVFAGLLYSATTDNCFLKIFIAQLPWNRSEPELSQGNSIRKNQLSLNSLA